MSEEKQWYYFTFCQSQRRLKDMYIKFYGTYGEAREQMFENFDSKWAFQYKEEDFIRQIEAYGLREII